jgi:hypothetical protein
LALSLLPPHEKTISKLDNSYQFSIVGGRAKGTLYYYYYYIGSFNTNYIIFKNVKIFKNWFFFPIKTKKKLGKKILNLEEYSPSFFLFPK